MPVEVLAAFFTVALASEPSSASSPCRVVVVAVVAVVVFPAPFAAVDVAPGAIARAAVSTPPVVTAVIPAKALTTRTRRLDRSRWNAALSLGFPFMSQRSARRFWQPSEKAVQIL